MKIRKTDRRSLRTQGLVGDALVSLMLEKGYYDITIQDILERANIGRSTFYEHYYDKDDLLTSQIEHMVERFGQQKQEGHIISGDTSTFIPSLALFQHIQEQEKLYHALLQRGGSLQGRGLEVVTRILQDRLREHVEAIGYRHNTADLRLSAIATYIAGAFINLLQWWLETDMVWPPERIDALFHELVQPGVQQLLAQTFPP